MSPLAFLASDHSTFESRVEDIVRIVEIVGIAVLVGGGVVVALGWALFPGRFTRDGYTLVRRGLGRVILLGLEILVAADIIRTVTIEPTLESVGALGLLVLVRTVLSWSIVVELEGTWPWKMASLTAARDGQTAGTGSNATDPPTRTTS